MAASSVTGKGIGASDKPTSKELATIGNGPSILIAGTIESEGGMSSPPSSSNTVVFPNALPGAASKYIVILTTLNGGYAYVTHKDETDGNFVGFDFVTEADCTLMYIVTKIGSKPNV